MKNLFSLFLLLITIYVNAQVYRCGDVLYKNLLEQKYPGISKLIPHPMHNHAHRSSTVYRIPVVVHVVYNNASENLSDDIVRSQIDILNKDFRRLNSDATNTRDIFKSVAGDAMIEFELASIDPQGKPTTGITRTKTTKSSFLNFNVLLFLQAAIECGVDFTDPASIEANQECLEAFFEKNGANFENILETIDDVKYTDKGGIDPWNQKKYLNLWVCDLSVDLLGQSVPFLLGFAYPPVGAPLFPKESLPEGYEKNDGVVVHYQVFGINNPAIGELEASNGKGRTCTHEVGHYLGLRHIWGDGDCSVDDGIADTPDAEDSSQSQDGSIPDCATLFQKNTCSETENEQPDMIENYMDYSRESCMNMFTNGQIDMMRAMLEGPRSELIGLSASSNEVSDGIDFSIFPNPSSQYITVRSSDGENISKIVFINGQGQQFLQKGNGGQFDVSTLTNGWYMLKIQYKETISIKKFIKI